MLSTMRREIRTRVLPVLCAAGAALAAGCAINPVTGQRQLALISESQEIQIGQQAAQEVAQSLGLVNDDALQAYVQRLGARLAAASERPGLPWTFRVVDDPTPNAFALPGGYIFITRGMMNLMDSEAELAAVLGHEIGHVTARHSVTQISRAQLAQLGLGVGSIFFPSAAQQLGGLASGGLQLLFLSYGRDAERQSDELAFKYALSQGYDVREMDDIFATLQRIGEAEGRSPLPSWQSSHPAPAERIQAVEARLATLTGNERLTLGAAEYLGQIDGLAYGENPRNGFFRGGLFLHPDLRFQLRFPEGWRTQNLSQSVTAVSPRQDAVIQLSLAGATSAEDAARRFLAQQGVQGGQTFRDRINGVPAVVSAFQAQTQQGVIAGRAAFLEYGGKVYQILSYTPGAAFNAYDRTFQGVIGSFAPVTDPEVLNVIAPRVDIVRLDRAMSLTEFNRRFPSVIPLEELALINQVVDVNAALPVGKLLKRIIREPARR
ncbi:MAG TPA: M48 family metalloprotease [Longimicrobiaceae bacterium]|nr:M48 family metalloprotease [Longimicrobiaceae bacterium]